MKEKKPAAPVEEPKPVPAKPAPIKVQEIKLDPAAGPTPNPEHPKQGGSEREPVPIVTKTENSCCNLI